MSGIMVPTASRFLSASSLSSELMFTLFGRLHLGRLPSEQQRHESLSKQLKKILMNAQEAVAALNAIKAQNAKALAEIRGKLDGLLKTIEDLQGTIANGQLPQEVTDAISAVATSSQELDDIVPDAPPPTP